MTGSTNRSTQKEVMECEFRVRAEIIYRGTETAESIQQGSSPPPMVLLREADWKELLDRLEASVAAQEALLRALSQQMGQRPTQEQTEALARDVA